jgi:hypothetical protein
MPTLLTRLTSCAFLLALGACAVEDEDTGELDDEEMVERGLKFMNGLKLMNGLKFMNGLQLSDGTSLASGLAVGTGLNPASALTTEAGLSTTTGLFKTAAGQQLLQYVVECALPAGQSITKGTKTFSGAIGVGAAWKTGACDTTCQQQVSACLLARTNEIGTNVLIDMRSSITQIGTGSSGASYTIQEGAFFGNLFSNPPKAFACKGVDGSFGIFEGRTCANGGSCGMVGIGNYCRNACKPGLGKTYYDCVAGGTTYNKVITTYLDPTPYAAGCPAGCDACYNGTCTFICTPGNPCTTQLMDCPAGWDCEALCSGLDSCKNATLDCGGTDSCALTCVDKNACAGAKLTCVEADCDVYCENAESCNAVAATVTGAGDVVMQCTGGLSSGEMCTDSGAGTCTKTGC